MLYMRVGSTMERICQNFIDCTLKIRDPHEMSGPTCINILILARFDRIR